VMAGKAVILVALLFVVSASAAPLTAALNDIKEASTDAKAAGDDAKKVVKKIHKTLAAFKQELSGSGGVDLKKAMDKLDHNSAVVDLVKKNQALNNVMHHAHPRAKNNKVIRTAVSKMRDELVHVAADVRDLAHVSTVIGEEVKEHAKEMKNLKHTNEWVTDEMKQLKNGAGDFEDFAKHSYAVAKAGEQAVSELGSSDEAPEVEASEASASETKKENVSETKNENASETSKDNEREPSKDDVREAKKDDAEKPAGVAP